MSVQVPGVRWTKRPDGVAVVWFDTPDSPVNVLSRAFFGAFAQALDGIAADPEVVAVVLASAKPDSFIAGADLKDILPLDAKGGEALSRDGHALLDRMAASAKPVVAAIHGPCLGGGLEVALACHYRLASDDARTVLGLPEVQLGLLPGGGGTQRLPRLIGLLAALPMVLTGKRVRAKESLKLGLVDALTGPYGLVDTAALAALALANKKMRGRKRRPTLADRAVGFAPVRGFVLGRARDEVRATTRGHYPAPGAILDCIEAGLTRGMAAGLAYESRRFGELVGSPQAKQLIQLFDATTELKKEGGAGRPVRKLAVLGAGLMGEGIASVSIGPGHDARVVLRDMTDAALGKAAKGLHAGLAKRQKSGGMTAAERDRAWSMLHFTTDLDALKGADLVIEAVFERLDIKRTVLAEAEARIAPDAVFASNTSALPIREIAAEARHPERVLGMHYFSPVPKMPLLEVVAGPQTAAWAIDVARRYGAAQGKTVIVVQDGPGFYTTRILAPFMAEAVRLLEEGAAIRHVDRALRDFGFPVGPFALLDEVGLDVGAHVGRDMGAAFAARGMGGSDVLPRMVEAGLLGRKSGKGFYLYGKKSTGKKPVNPTAYNFFGGPARKTMVAAEVADRLALLMVNEAVHCLSEGVIACPRDGDVGAVLGLGFPPFRGGPFRHVDAVGAKVIVARLCELAKAHGVRFEPAPRLVAMAESGGTFYPVPSGSGPS